MKNYKKKKVESMPGKGNIDQSTTADGERDFVDFLREGVELRRADTINRRKKQQELREDFSKKYPFLSDILKQFEDKIWRNLNLGAIEVPFYYDGSFMFNTPGTKLTGVIVIIIFILSCL